MDPEEVLDHIGRQPKGRSHFKHLAKQLRAKGGRRVELQDALDSLVRSGRLIETRQHYQVPQADPDHVIGRFSRHPDGFGFVAPERPIPDLEGDIYIGRASQADAMHGDLVAVRLKRFARGRAEGRIERILDRAQTTVVGKFHYAESGCWVTPYDERVQHDIVISGGAELPPPEALGERLGNVTPPPVEHPRDLDGMIVTAEVTQFPKRSQEAAGRVIEVLGRPDDFGVDVEIIIRKYHIPHRFPPDVREEVEALSPEIEEEELFRREDFRDLDIVTIDGETARDFDDAVWVDRLDDGRFALQVHIADVSHYVRPGTALDREARRRGTSVYFPDRAVPMLPGKLSTDVCSLVPQQDRLVLSVLVEIDPKGDVVGARFTPGVIRSAERMTYTNVYRVLEGDPEASARYQHLVERFGLMKELAEVLRRRRIQRGAIDLDMPEAEIEFDEEGRMVSVRRAERNVAHRIIEEFMLTANEAVARHLEGRGAETLFRIHEKPSPKRVLEFEELAATMGHSLGSNVKLRRFTRHDRRRDGSRRHRRVDIPENGFDISPRQFQKLVERLEGRPEQRILSYYLLRSLKQARYSEENAGHFALASESYTHFTSPIRRYPDLIVHRILKEALAGGKPASPYRGERPEAAYRILQLAAIASESSDTERRAADAERELVDWKKARFMEERLGDEFDAMVIAVTEAGLFVELQDLFIEGLAPVDSFPGERFYFRDDDRSLAGQRSKRVFRVGDRIRVRADRVAFDRMRTEFSWIPPQGETPRSSTSRSGSRRRRV